MRARSTNLRSFPHLELLQTYCSLCTFMFGYHVHEKAIMSAIIPLTLLATVSREHARLYLRTCAFGHFGMFPLLFRPTEMLFKICAYVMHFALSTLLLERFHDIRDQSGNAETLRRKSDKFSLLVLLLVGLFAEVIHRLSFNPLGHLEFLPLMATSVVCAMGLVSCWVSSGHCMWKCADVVKHYSNTSC